MTIEKAKNELETMRRRLDAVSPSFCLAKWLQVTIHLQNGLTHSCHHPVAHKIPLSELQNNLSALHNTHHKKNQRKLMLDGKRPEECSYCWKMEDASKNNISDRHIKSNDTWAEPFFDDVKSMPWDADVMPRYVEVSFSHHCNFKCSYCVPNVSSKWMEEIKQHGPYKLRSQDLHATEWVMKSERAPIPLDQPNPYVEAFWKWWPSLFPSLKMFRITGGEPLLSPDTFRILDFFIENANTEMELAINSNLGVPKPLIEKMIGKIQEIERLQHLKSIQIYTSVDTFGEQAEYIRHGMDFEKFWGNLEMILTELPSCNVTIMCTFNLLSIPRFKLLLENILRLKQLHLGEKTHQRRFMIDISTLNWPHHQAPQNITPDFHDHLRDALEFVTANVEDLTCRRAGFNVTEIVKMQRLVDFIVNTRESESVRTARIEFFEFFTEHDRRRGSNFIRTFPELKEFFTLCSRLKTSDEMAHVAQVDTGTAP